MTPYYIFILVLIQCVFAEDALASTKKKKHILVLALVPYFILMAFKSSSVGTDTSNYFQSFSAMSWYPFSGFWGFDEYGYERIEKGYKLYIWLLSRISSDGQILMIATTIINTAAIYSFIRKNAKNYSLALFFFVTLGFFQFAMSGIRQTLAISIVLFGYEYLRDRKLIKFSIVVLLAMLFHKSAIFFFPAYFVVGMKLNRTNIGLALASTFVIYFIAGDLFLTAADVLDYDYSIESTNNGYVFFGVVLLITLLSIINSQKIIAAKDVNSNLIKLNMISLALWTMRLVSRTAERITFYYMPYTYITLEQIISTRKKGERTIWLVGAILLCSYLCLRRLSLQEDFNNYTFFFEVPIW